MAGSVAQPIKVWSKPVSTEEAARYDKITEERALYQARQKALVEDALKRAASACDIQPVMSNEQIARCR